ncbi:type VII secretion protein EccCa [Mycobacterium avium subsp. hominissuis]|uniref:type VII secretion protein EccCa n=1 Tax=Mycobacterium avium TaxID=1764 RepID=UPI002666FBCA|nr:type VII secretion protein EccCa [Mycobacterium avium]MDO2394817.1 type VII secretion protein EccCa [Mycobacterium avium subsp. hominissuis]
MRTRFPQRRRVSGPVAKPKDFNFEPPPELPRTIEVPAWKKALPLVFGIVIVGMVVMMFVMGFRQMNPMYLFFMAMMALGLFSSLQGQGANTEMTKAEVDSERAEYLRYLSGKAEEIRAAADAQKAKAEWSHPDPDLLEAVLADPTFDPSAPASAARSQRMWERGASDDDYLHIRVGRDEVKLAAKIRVKPVESELDLEPVTKTALQHMRAVQQSIPHCPKAIDFAGIGMIGVHGDRELFEGAVRAWIAQLVCWHTPNDTALAIVSPHLEKRWGWAKWLPHTEGQDIDGAGPARFLSTSLRDVETMLEPLLKERAKTVDDKGAVNAASVSKANKHVVVVIDDPDAPAASVRRIAARDGVTVIAYRHGAGPDPDYAVHQRELLLRIIRQGHSTDATATMDYWDNFRWKTFCAEPDTLDIPAIRHLARQLSKWDSASVGRQDAESAAAQTNLSLLGITNAANLDVAALWKPRMLPVGTGEPVDLEPLLRVPIGLQPSGAPLIVDLKDEADGGNGPHGLMIGMTGSGKSTTLAALVVGLFLQHSPDVVQAFLADFKDGAGFDALADYPHVVGLVTNMEEKKSLVDRFGDTLLGLLDQRGRIFHEAGNQIKGAAFSSLLEYNEARATPAGAHLPPVPYMMVIVDEFSLLLRDHPDMADVFDVVTRKGRSQGVHFLFASQTLDEGVIKQIPNNTQYRIGLKVASESISRRVIGAPDAYHIPDGKNVKGTGYFVRAPGAEPVKYRGFMLPSRYEPPTTINRRVISANPRARLFTAGRVEPDPDTVIEEEVAAESVIDGPPRSLALTVGPQLKAYYGKQAAQLWAPPLDEPIPLDSVLREAQATPRRGSTPWWPLGEIDRPRQLSHGLLSYGLDEGNISLLAASKDEASTVVQTFVLSAAARYSPQDIGFYILGYGGPAVAAVRELPHVGAIGGEGRNELNLRIFGDLEVMLARRRRIFDENNVLSLEQWRQRRRDGEAALDDGYPTDIFVIVDGWENFIKDNTSLMNPKNPQMRNVEALSGGGRGVHIMVTASDWIGLGTTIQGQINTRYELKLAQSTNSQVRARIEDKMIRPQDRIPADQPGRGITFKGDVIRFAVGRTDGVASMEDLDLKIGETVAQIVAKSNGQRPAPRPRLLPTRIPIDRLPRGLGGERHAIGLRGRDLQPLVINFAAEPLLAVYGDDHQGKSTFIRNMVTSIVTERTSVDEACILLFDPKRRQGDLTRILTESHPDSAGNADYYATDAAQMATYVESLAAILDKRQPPAGMSWEERRSWSFEGPKIYLIVDDLDVVPSRIQVHAPVTAGGPPVPGAGRTVVTWEPLLRHFANAADRGLRVIVTHRAADVSTAEISPTSIPHQIATQPSTRIMLASRAHNEKVAGVKFEAGLAPGRANVLATNDDNGGYVQLAADPDGM